MPTQERNHSLTQIDLFSTPIWTCRVPEFETVSHRANSTIRHGWKTGVYQKHKYGYGFQSPPTLFEHQHLRQQPEYSILKQAFINGVEKILRQRVGLASALVFDVYAVVAWNLIQTHEEWVQSTWHDHYPATISGVYYLQIPEVDSPDEAALLFKRPSTQDMFVQHVVQIFPKQGDFILFPSNLPHKPAPCPSAKDLRISIAMDAFVHWRMPNEEGKPQIPSAHYMDLLKNSLDF